MLKVPKTVFIAARNLKAGDVVKGKRILAEPVIHSGIVHYFAFDSRNNLKQVSHQQIVADKELTVRRPRYNHVVFSPPKVAHQNHTVHAEPAKESTVDKIMKQLADFF